jgi:hypothetical protein
LWYGNDLKPYFFGYFHAEVGQAYVETQRERLLGCERKGGDQTEAPTLKGTALAQPGTEASDKSLNVTYYGCMIGIDDYEFHFSKCGDRRDAVFPCYYNDGIDSSYSAMARAACKMHTPQGDVPVRYELGQLSNDDGGRCGVSTYKIVCHYPEGTQILYDTGIENAPRLGCGQSGDSVALSICRGLKTPTDKFSVITTWYQGGAGCGITNVRAICYK